MLSGRGPGPAASVETVGGREGGAEQQPGSQAAVDRMSVRSATLSLYKSEESLERGIGKVKQCNYTQLNDFICHVAEPAGLPLHPAAEQEQQFPLPRAAAGALQRRLPQTPRTLHLPRRSGIVDIIARPITVSAGCLSTQLLRVIIT